jgi:oligopeptide/dipeptide ABC transporter ATP-binding protein
VMYGGRIVEEGTTQDIFRRALHPYTQMLIGLCARYTDIPGTRTEFNAIEGEPPASSLIPPGCCFASRCPERMQICMDHDPQERAIEPSHRVSCFLYGE